MLCNLPPLRVLVFCLWLIATVLLFSLHSHVKTEQGLESGADRPGGLKGDILLQRESLRQRLPAVVEEAVLQEKLAPMFETGGQEQRLRRPAISKEVDWAQTTAAVRLATMDVTTTNGQASQEAFLIQRGIVAANADRQNGSRELLRPLRWRAASYNDEDREQDGSAIVYGGEHTVARFAAQGFVGPVLDDSWDVLWNHAPMQEATLFQHRQGRSTQLVNHCGYFSAAGQKCTLAEHLLQVINANPHSSDRYLRTFNLHNPDEYKKWQHAAESAPNKYWVVKPCTSGASQGIELLRGNAVASSGIDPGTWSVAQEYLSDPYLGLGGKKFHLRLYVLATRWTPVPGVLLFNDGLLFQSRSSYSGRRPSLHNDIFSSVGDQVRPLSLQKSLWKHLDRKGSQLSKTVWGRVQFLLRDIFGTGLKDTFGDPARLSQRGYHCFDLFGVDLVLDSKLQPYIMEVNIGPNLWVDEDHKKLQTAVKGKLMDQVSHWAQLQVVRQPTTVHDATTVESEALPDFDRLL